MTVSTNAPIARYTGNGSETVFAWDWDMIADSSINVLVDNVNFYRWETWDLEGQNVVFFSAPDDGAEIIIYRRTIPRQPENFQAFGRFHSEKTELAMDRDILIAQERAGDSRHGEPYNGIVGGANLSLDVDEFTLTVVSERGTDALLELWNPDGTAPPDPGDPDSTIVWAGADIEALAFSSGSVACTIRFLMILTGGDPAAASAYYPYLNETQYVSWVNVDPADGDYWMRVTLESVVQAGRYVISDGDANYPANTAFKIRGQSISPDYGPYVSVFTFGDTAPSVQTGTFNIEICKDNGSSQPDGNWASRIVTLEARYNG